VLKLHRLTWLKSDNNISLRNSRHDDTTNNNTHHGDTSVMAISIGTIARQSALHIWYSVIFFNVMLCRVSFWWVSWRLILFVKNIFLLQYWRFCKTGKNSLSSFTESFEINWIKDPFTRPISQCVFCVQLILGPHSQHFIFFITDEWNKSAWVLSMASLSGQVLSNALAN